MYFIKLTEKDISDEKHNDLYGHVVLPGVQYFKGYHLKFVRCKGASFKQLQIFSTRIVLRPDEIHDTYVDINEKLQLDINIYYVLPQKAIR